MSETIKLGDTVRFQAIITHPTSGYVVNVDSNVRYYAFINDSDTVAVQGDMTLKSGFTGLYRGSFGVTQANTFASGQYVSVKASGTVGGVTGWGNLKDFIVSDIALANIVQWSGIGSHPDDVGTKVWNYGNSPMSRMVDIYSIGMKANAASALGTYWDCVAIHSYPVAGGTSNTITLNSADTYAVDNIASGCKIKISSGTGEGQYRTIVGFIASPYKVATVSEPWVTIPQSGLSNYIIYDGESNPVVKADIVSIAGNAGLVNSSAGVCADVKTILGNSTAGNGLYNLAYDYQTSGSIRASIESVYYANIKYARKNTAPSTWQDYFASQWYKNGSVVTSGQLTSPKISVYNTTDGTALVSHANMSYSSPVLGSTYYLSSNPTVTNSGIPYMVAISGTIDGQMRQWNQIVGLDLL